MAEASILSGEQIHIDGFIASGRIADADQSMRTQAGIWRIFSEFAPDGVNLEMVDQLGDMMFHMTNLSILGDNPYIRPEQEASRISKIERVNQPIIPRNDGLTSHKLTITDRCERKGPPVAVIVPTENPVLTEYARRFDDHYTILTVSVDGKGFLQVGVLTWNQEHKIIVPRGLATAVITDNGVPPMCSNTSKYEPTRGGVVLDIGPVVGDQNTQLRVGLLDLQTQDYDGVTAMTILLDQGREHIISGISQTMAVLMERC